MKSDAEIRDDVINELYWDPQVTEPEAIGVAVRDGAVTLTGHVPSYAEKLAAARAAERVYGVKAVANDLKVQFSRAPRDDSDIAAAVYGASEGLRTIVLDGTTTGGQAGTSARIENYLGFPSGISGAELAERAMLQARKFGAEFVVPAEAASIEKEGGQYLVRLADGSPVTATSVVIATGPGTAGWTCRSWTTGTMTHATWPDGADVLARVGRHWGWMMASRDHIPAGRRRQGTAPGLRRRPCR